MEQGHPSRSAGFCRRLRERRQWTRGQAARRLKVSPAVLYNIETGRSRASLSFAFTLLSACGHDVAATLGRFQTSVRELTDLTGATLVRDFRARLRWSQRELATKLGYKSAAMIHHFEKGLREPDLDDLFMLMELARDDVRGLVLAVTGDETFAAEFRAGVAAARLDWVEYWSNPHVAAVRQLMRTTAYEQASDYTPGQFARAIGITDEEERQALDVLRGLGVVKDANGRPEIDPAIRIVIPRDVPRALLDGFKTTWVDRMKGRYLAAAGSPDQLCSIDLIPVNRALYASIVARIRALQDEIHNLPLVNTDGFACLGWMGSYAAL